jgi:hypothetical protein
MSQADQDGDEELEEREGDAGEPSTPLVSFKAAMLCYAALVLLSALTLTGKFRIFILIVLAGVALKTYIHHIRERLE